MKTVINGVTYDTGIAERIGSYMQEESDYACSVNVIYLQGRQLFIHCTIPFWHKEYIYLIGEQKPEKPVIQDWREYWEED